MRIRVVGRTYARGISRMVSIFKIYVTVPEKRVLVANNDFSILGTKLLCLSQRYLPLFAYTHTKFERVEVFLKGQARCLKTAT